MTRSLQMRRPIRATRVSLRGRIVVTIQLENGRRRPAKLHQLSITGGLLEISNYLEERSKVRLGFPIGELIVQPKAEMLFPMWGANGYLQPFRFTQLWAEERRMLETEITELLKQTVARSTPGQGTGLRPPPFYLESF
jgi:hypothetical protein